MERVIINPFVGLDFYNCFGCAPNNDKGLRMKFYENEDEIFCRWEVENHFQGWPTSLHGGIQAALMDEISCWLVLVKLGSAGVTRSINIKFRKAVDISHKTILLKAKLKSINKQIAEIIAELRDEENELCSIGEITYFVFDEKTAKEKFFYPGKSAFLK